MSRAAWGTPGRAQASAKGSQRVVRPASGLAGILVPAERETRCALGQGLGLAGGGGWGAAEAWARDQRGRSGGPGLAAMASGVLLVPFWGSPPGRTPESFLHPQLSCCGWGGGANPQSLLMPGRTGTQAGDFLSHWEGKRTQELTCWDRVPETGAKPQGFSEPLAAHLLLGPVLHLGHGRAPGAPGWGTGCKVCPS